MDDGLISVILMGWFGISFDGHESCILGLF